MKSRTVVMLLLAMLGATFAVAPWGCSSGNGEPAGDGGSTGPESGLPPSPSVTVQLSGELGIRVFRAPVRIEVLGPGDRVLARGAGTGADGYQGLLSYQVDPKARPWSSAAADRWVELLELQSYARDTSSGDAHLFGFRTSEGDDGRAQITLRVHQPDTRRIVLAVRFADPTGVKRLAARFALRSGEQVFGLGRHYDSPASRGRVRDLQLASGNSHGTGSNEVHAPIPFALLTRGIGILTQTEHMGRVDVGKEAPGTMSIEIEGASLDLHLLRRDTPLGLVEAYSELAGRPPRIPDWALGPHHWRDIARDAGQILADAEAMRRAGIPGSAIWIDAPWQTAYSTFAFNPKQFPNPAGTISRLHQLGFKVVAWACPFLNVSDDSAEKAGMKPDTGGLYEEAAKQGYLVKGTDGKPLVLKWAKGKGSLVDFTNPAAAVWWKGLIKAASRAGIDGWKLDEGATISHELSQLLHFHDGSTGRRAHGRYKVLYLRTFRQAMEESRGADGAFIVSRVGHHGAQQYLSGSLSAGLNSSFDQHFGLRAAVVAEVSAGMVGLPYVGSAIGGSRHGPPGKEVLLRWAALGALSPLMQLGGEGNHEPWDRTRFDQQTEDVYRELARLHMDLTPYLLPLAREAREKGRPMVRHLYLHYPADRLAWGTGDQYLLGRDLLVAPITRAGGSRTVYFPAGRWIDYYDGKVVRGPRTRSVVVPLNRAPLYLREGAVVPLLWADVDTLAPATDYQVVTAASRADRLRIRLTAGAQGESRATLVDGTVISFTRGSKKRAVKISLAGRTRRYDLEMDFRDLDTHKQLEVTSVTAGGASLVERGSRSELEVAEQGWWQDRTGQLLVVRYRTRNGEVAVELGERR